MKTRIMKKSCLSDTRIIIVLVLAVMTLFSAGCSYDAPPASPQAEARADAPVEADPSAKEAPVTGLRFVYDMFSGNQFYLNAYVTGISADGSEAEIEKRVGPMNYTGHTKEGTILLNGSRTGELLGILDRYDLEAWSHLPTGSAGSAPSRSLIVFSGDDILYDIPWNARFPASLPPEEDVFYCELFNFFNGILSEEPGWEEVRSDDLDDPRDDPAYSERRVMWFGKQVRLVPGTGTWYEDGRYAEIDYEGRDWWIEEGFTGTWILDEEAPSDGLNTPKSASLTVYEDGTVRFVLDGEEWSGAADAVRKYLDSAGFCLEKGYDRRPCSVVTTSGESYERIHVTCYPGPVPEEQFPPIDVYLLKK